MPPLQNHSGGEERDFDRLSVGGEKKRAQEARPVPPLRMHLGKTSVMNGTEKKRTGNVIFHPKGEGGGGRVRIFLNGHRERRWRCNRKLSRMVGGKKRGERFHIARFSIYPEEREEEVQGEGAVLTAGGYNSLEEKE